MRNQMTDRVAEALNTAFPVTASPQQAVADVLTSNIYKVIDSYEDAVYIHAGSLLIHCYIVDGQWWCKA